MQLITQKQLSVKFGGRSRSALNSDVREGRIPKPIKIGILNYWDEAEIDQLLCSLKEQEAESC